ncbi:DUF1421 domain-containing protein [Psidium guajava]|nr:DUF1421 domain-containing protein [Psidium guajava]
MGPSSDAGTTCSPLEIAYFGDPLHDGKTMLKIWNVNKYTGVLGVFNCQGGGWCPKSRRNKSASEFSHTVLCNTQVLRTSNGTIPRILFPCKEMVCSWCTCSGKRSLSS